MGSYSSALASAEVLVGSATDLLIDAANVLHDAGDRGAAQEIKALAESSEGALERLRRKRLTAEADESAEG